MKKIILIILFSFSVLVSQESDYSFAIKFTSTAGLNKTLNMGVSDSTTDNFDEKVEKDMPPFPPIGEIIPYLFIYDTLQKEYVYSPIDVKGFPVDSTKFLKEYAIKLLGSSDVDYTMEWFISNAKIDSAKIFDGFTNNIDMFSSTSSTFSRFLKNFTIKIYYNTKINTSINEENKAHTISYYPNPVKNIINIIDTDVKSVQVITSIGEVIKSTKSSYLDVSDLPKGLYFLKLQKDKQTFTEKFLKE